MKTFWKAIPLLFITALPILFPMKTEGGGSFAGGSGTSAPAGSSYLDSSSSTQTKTGGLTVNGTVTANKVVGDGSGLTGITAVATSTSGAIAVSTGSGVPVISTATTLDFNAAQVDVVKTGTTAQFKLKMSSFASVENLTTVLNQAKSTGAALSAYQTAVAASTANHISSSTLYASGVGFSSVTAGNNVTFSLSAGSLQISATGGSGGSSALEVTDGVVSSSPAATIRVNSAQFSQSNDGSTATWTAKPSTFTMLGANPMISSVAANAVTLPSISATGTRDNTTYLRGDGTWNTPAGGTGASVYPATATASFPYGVTGTTGVFTGTVSASYFQGTGTGALVVGSTSNHVYFDPDGNGVMNYTMAPASFTAIGNVKASSGSFADISSSGPVKALSGAFGSVTINGTNVSTFTVNGTDVLQNKTIDASGNNVLITTFSFGLAGPVYFSTVAVCNTTSTTNGFGEAIFTHNDSSGVNKTVLRKFWVDANDANVEWTMKFVEQSSGSVAGNRHYIVLIATASNNGGNYSTAVFKLPIAFTVSTAISGPGTTTTQITTTGWSAQVGPGGMWVMVQIGRDGNNALDTSLNPTMTDASNIVAGFRQ